jgi:hypothetical protein
MSCSALSCQQHPRTQSTPVIFDTPHFGTERLASLINQPSEHMCSYDCPLYSAIHTVAAPLPCS